MFRSHAFRRSVATILVLAAAEMPVPAAQEEKRHNVVILLADDLGYGDLACYGGKIPAPNIERLAATGALFTQAYAPAPVCCPSRAGLLTGQYPARIGVQANMGNIGLSLEGERGLQGEVATVPERLRALGYHTGLIGKWDLGMNPGMTPLGQGLDEFFGFLGPAHEYLPSDASFKMLRGETPEEEHEKEYLTDAFAREAEAFLGRNKERPFVLSVCFNAPHYPYEATEAYLRRFPDASGEERVYAAMIAALDDAVGRILAALEKEGLRERTLVFFASDNGAPAGIPLAPGPGSNGALRLGKAYLFEGGCRVPMILSWPGRTKAGTRMNAPVSLLDIAATTLELAGASPAALAGLDGVDLGPLLSGEPRPERSLFWRLGPSAAIRKGAWKLVTSNQSRWLFNLDDDPGELLDLAAREPERAGALAAELDAWTSKLPGPLWKNNAFKPVKVLDKPYWVEF